MPLRQLDPIQFRILARVHDQRRDVLPCFRDQQPGRVQVRLVRSDQIEQWKETSHGQMIRWDEIDGIVKILIFSWLFLKILLFQMFVLKLITDEIMINSNIMIKHWYCDKVQFGDNKRIDLNLYIRNYIKGFPWSPSSLIINKINSRCCLLQALNAASAVTSNAKMKKGRICNHWNWHRILPQPTTMWLMKKKK